MVEWKAYRDRNRHSDLPKYKKIRFWLIGKPFRNYQPFRRFIHNDLAERLVKSSFRSDKIDVFLKK